jgi:NAD(P)-dependent dehydrogenase (short-subunit alcohol dehydrogenase family)
VNEFSLDGRVALVTGASSGIGQGIAISLARAGARVVGLGRNRKGLEETAAQIRAARGEFHAHEADLATPGAGAAAVEAAVRSMGQLHILVNAAGVQRRKPAFEITEADWEAMLAVNLRGLFFTSQAAARQMVAQRDGVIINITSLTSVFGIPELSVHGSIKGAVTQMTKALAVEWAKHNVRVNAIGPGRIRTPMTEEVFNDPAVRERFVSLIPMGRGGMPSDIGGTAVFLASPAAAYITGQTIYVDGGWLAGGGSPSR